jgi:hypothetical protein
MFTSKDSIIALSGQAKKWNTLLSLLIASGLLLILCILSLSLNFNLSEQVEITLFLLALLGLLSGFILIVLLSLLIKCPQCNLRWFWYGISKDFKHNIMIGNMSHCKNCNYPENQKT